MLATPAKLWTGFANLAQFSRLILGCPLRRYQHRPIEAVLDSVVHGRGLEFLIIFPRQSGKNEAIAQLLIYLLNLYWRKGGNIVYGATGDGLGLGIRRLEARLRNPLNMVWWAVSADPARRVLGQAAVVFLSSHPSAATRGQTAHHLLVIDEAQDQVASHIEAVFTPMRAAHNATAVYIGTVKHTADYLWQKKLELEREQRTDGIQRVFMVGPDEVIAANPAYRLFLDTQVQKHGRQHPIVASEYYLEPIDATGGLFDERRRALMRGDHPRQHAPQTGQIYVATLDVAGEDEAATDPIARLARPGRDYTVATIFSVQYPPPGTYAPGPTYRALDVFVDHGSKHFQDHPGRPALVQRLLAWLQHWHVAHLVGDESGVGQGLVSWLIAALGDRRVSGFDFAGPGKKAALGSAFLSLIETGRFKYWADDPGDFGELSGAATAEATALGGSAPDAESDVGSVSGLSDAAAAESTALGGSAPDAESDVGSVSGLSDAAWFWQQARACTYEVPPDGRFDRDLRWEVPPSHKTDTPGGPQPTHDDRLLSAALIAELDRLLRTGRVVLGTAESTVIHRRDPLGELRF